LPPRRTEIDKADIEVPETSDVVETEVAQPVSYKQKPFLLGVGIALAVAGLSIFLLRGMLFKPTPHPSPASAPTPKGYPGTDGLDPNRALLAARGQYDPTTSTYFAAVAFPVHTPREVRVLSFLLGFGISPQHSSETQARLQEQIPAIRQAIEQVFLNPEGAVLFEESPQEVEKMKTQVATAAVETLKTQRTLPLQDIERVFVKDFLYH